MGTKRRIYLISSSEDEDRIESGKKKPLQNFNNSPTAKPIKSLKSNAKILEKLVEMKKLKKLTPNVIAEKPKPRLKRKVTSTSKIPKIPKIKKTENVEDDQEMLPNVEPLNRSSIQPEWQDHEILESEHKIPTKIAKNIMHLFNEGNTIPFIARYRKEAIGKMSPDELRNVKNTYDNIIELKRKMVSSYLNIHELGKMTDNLSKTLLNVRSLETLEEVYAPYKPVDAAGSIKRQIYNALEECASDLLEAKEVSFADYIGKAPTLDSVKSVETNLVLVMAKKIAANSSILQYLQKKKTEIVFTLNTKKINKRQKEGDTKNQRNKVQMKKKSNNDESKFTDYYDRTFHTHQLKPHQIMAINRAEHLKFINVKLEVNDFFAEFQALVKSKWTVAFENWKTSKICEMAVNECYQILVLPLLKRLKRNELKAFAEKASLEIFSGNLKQLLLAAPVKGKKILGVDPGYTHGCKLAVISDTGSLLATGVVYPHNKDNKRRVYENMLRDILIDHNCSLIALGNGKGCRETESWITDMINKDFFRPLQVSYTIVNESGASVYSCSKEATKEFKKLDPNKISAVSLARRVQEPLAELVKIDPKHLGVGMYQHDINQKRLEEALTEVVSECVSFVGIDINTASQCLLKYVAGLSDRRAKEIVQYREENGPFEKREELMKVKGIGSHTFKQCAGFLKIINGIQKLDSTIVHPESYDIARDIMKHLNLSVDHIGEDQFIQSILRQHDSIVRHFQSASNDQENLETILEGLSKPLNYDLRFENNREPLFKKGITSISALSVDMLLTGAVNNVTSFGYFVDIGVGNSGLLHSKMAKGVKLQIGDRIEVRVTNIEISRQRIGLELVQKL